MNTGNHTTALIGHVLAPGPAKTPAVSLAQYAVSSWSRGAFILLIAVILVALAVVRFAVTRGRP